MQILNSGSFISLENEAKIEQLKHTACELAVATIESPGFVNHEAKNRTLGHELWNGLEYMCRDHEEPAIKNIFVNCFVAQFQVDERPIVETSPALEVKQDKNHDEFLGHLENSDDAEKPIVEPEAELVVEDDNVEAQQQDGEESTDSFSDVELSEEDIEIVTSSEGLCDEVETETSEDETSNLETLITLPEKEPYQFDKCTVMIAVQLLPIAEQAENRRAILSVRTHDFPPQISLVSLPVNDLDRQISNELSNALSRYKGDLPIRVMDKMRLEKSVGKKKTSIPAATTPINTTTSNSPTQNSQTASIKTESSQQGSLFG